MLKTYKILLIIFWAVWSASTALAFGQDVPHGKWWHNDKVSEGMKLSNEEKGQLDKKFLESRRKFIELKSAVEKEKLELEIIMEKEAVDETAVMKQFRKLESARTNLAAERFSFVLAVRRIVGFERYQQLKTAFKDQRKRGAKRSQKKPHREKTDKPE